MRFAVCVTKMPGLRPYIITFAVCDAEISGLRP